MLGWPLLEHNSERRGDHGEIADEGEQRSLKDDKKFSAVFFLLWGLFGFSSIASPLGINCRTYRIMVHFAIVIMYLLFPVVYYCTDGLGYWDKMQLVDRTLVPVEVKTDMAMCVIVPIFAVFSYGMIKEDFVAAEGKTSVVDVIWEARLPCHWREAHWALYIAPCLSLPAHIVLQCVVTAGGIPLAAEVYLRLTYGVTLILTFNFILYYQTVVTILRNEIYCARGALEAELPSDLRARYCRVQDLQSKWFDGKDLLKTLSRITGQLVLVCGLTIMADVYEVSILEDRGLTVEAGPLDPMISMILMQLVFNVAVIGMSLIPALLVTQACDELYSSLNGFAAKLGKAAAESQGRDREQVAHELALCRHFKDYLRDLNRQQGMGFCVLGFRISPQLLKAMAAFTTSLAAVYLPKFVRFFEG